MALRIAFYGPVFDRMGFSTASRAYVHALYSAGLDITVINLGRKHLNDPLVESLLHRNIEPDLHIFSFFPQNVLPLRLMFPRLIVQTAWETESIPEDWATILADVREVWVPCFHNANVFQKSLRGQVFVWPHPVNPQLEAATPDASRLPKLKESDFVIYSVFLWMERKNPLGMIAAFVNAFLEHNDVVLILKVRRMWIDIDQVNEQLQQQYRNAEVLKRIHIIAEEWTEGQMEALAQRGNCYIGLHRGEGWGYPIFDAACRGTPVVATGYAGPADYLDPQWHNIVSYVPVPVNQKFHLYNETMMWAEPDIEQATALLSDVHSHYGFHRERARAGAEQLKNRFSIERVGAMAKERLHSIYETLSDGTSGTANKLSRRAECT
jgi:glycosyltransferase involved in cell wall biosynthesis